MPRKLFDDDRGGISILAALMIVGVIGCSALALEYGNGLLQQVEDQRIADLAAYGGALVYNSTGSTTSTSSAVSKLASLNGLSCTSCSSVGPSPTGDGNQAVKVTVSSSAPLLLARVLTTSTSIPVSAAASAEINANTPGCIIALSGSGSGISLSGTGSITADNCQVELNSSICADGGANPSDAITTKYLSYNSGANPTTSSCTISPPSGTSSVHVSKASASDPLAGNSEVSGATSRITTVASITSPSAPTVSAPSGSAASFTKTGVTGLPTACSDVYNSTTLVYTVTCSGTADFGTITVSKVTVTINTSSGNTYNFSQSWPITGVTLSGSGGTYGFGAGITTSGTTTFPAGTYNVVGAIDASGTTTFAAGTYNVTGGIITEGGSTATFGAGNFNLGSNTATCGKKGPAGESICNSGTLTIAGPSTFVLAGGIYNSGGQTLTLGSGSTSNSYNIGVDGNGDSIDVSTSQSTTFNDTGSGDIFQAAGDIISGGGTCLWLPAATNHDINGYISLGGGTTLGAGIYTVTDYVAFGANNGGSETCNGSTVGVSGSGVTFVIGGAQTVSCGSSAQSFCVGAGFDPVILTAPSSPVTTAGLVMIGPTTSSANSSAGAWFGQGASNSVFSGAVYFPNGPIDMSGSATLGNGTGSSACLELIGSQITITNGAAAGTTCTGLGTGSSGTTIGLVQ